MELNTETALPASILLKENFGTTISIAIDAVSVLIGVSDGNLQHQGSRRNTRVLQAPRPETHPDRQDTRQHRRA